MTHLVATDPTGAALLAGVHADPHDLTARLVFADWLEESGKGHVAAFVRGQVDGSIGPVEYGDSWRGPGNIKPPRDLPAGINTTQEYREAVRCAAPRELRTVFGCKLIVVENGFVSRVTVRGAYVHLAAQLVDGFSTVTHVQCPLEDDDRTDAQIDVKRAFGARGQPVWEVFVQMNDRPNGARWWHYGEDNRPVQNPVRWYPSGSRIPHPLTDETFMTALRANWAAARTASGCARWPLAVDALIHEPT